MEEIIVRATLGAALLALVASLLSLVALSRRQRDSPTGASALRSGGQAAHGEFDFLLLSLEAIRRLASELATPLSQRKVPGILIAGIVHAFQPEKAVVLVRRPSVLSEPERGRQLILVERWPRDGGLHSGMEFDSSEAELFGGTTHAVACPDWGGPEGLSDSRRNSLSRLGCDVLVPMMKHDELLGLIGMKVRDGLSDHGGEVLETIAELGAFALHQASEIDQIRSLADVDWLTGILNKGAVVARLKGMLARAIERREALSVFLFDIDHFKHYNDVNGHLAGDALLRLLARSVKEHTRRDDVFGRFGGDEFLLVFPDRDLETAVRGGANVLQVVRELAFPFGTSQPLGRITLSGGVACFSAGLCSGTELLSRADEALYRAKRAGRDQLAAAAAPMGRALKLSHG